MPASPRAKTKICGAAILALLAFGPQAFAATGKTVWRCDVQNGQTQVDFLLPAEVDYHYFSLKNPRRLVIDLDAGTLPYQPTGEAAGCGIVQNLHWAQRKDDVLRYVLRLSEDAPVQLVPSPQKGHTGFDLSVRLGSPHRNAMRTPAGDTAATPAAPPPRALIKAHAGKGPIVIAIDPGHGGSDPGTRGPHGLEEKTVTLAIARILAHKIDATPGLAAVLTRRRDDYVGLRKRVLDAQDHHAALFVSIHANAYPRVPGVKGGAVYALSEHGASSAEAGLLARTENAADPTIGNIHFAKHNRWVNSALTHMAQTASMAQGSELAKDVLRHLARYEPLYEHHVQHANFEVLRDPVIPSILVETAFLSNPGQAHKLHEERFREDLAEAIYAGIREFLDHHDLSPVQLVRNAERGHHGKPPPGFPQASVQSTYRVKRGDTLSEVALHLHVSQWRLRVYNHLDSRRLRIGQVLHVPPGSFKYRVESGDNLSVIAEKADVSQQELKSYNDLSDNTLRIGQVLVVPPPDSQ